MQITTSNITLRNLIVSLAIALSICLGLATTSHAAEITPAEGTYTYGSTSEFSAYSTLAQGTSAVLAPTGSSQVIGYLVGISLLVIAGGYTLFVLQKRKV